MIYMEDMILTIFYACFGILLMITANTVIDLFVPGKFSAEIKRGNQAVAWLSAGTFIGIGEILRAVIMSPSIATVAPSLFQGIVSSLVYSILGIVLFVTGYMFVNLWHRKYNLSEEIMNGNTAAGILVFGIFVGLALVVSGAVH
ncbi:DUF350 domain-containing protein [Veillonella agrestimuris]|uniref:DUF350 domain-containing protein n=1 Tax=Veillonella agrestimuris TaxID=2941340 RepID=UPI0030B9B578